MRTNLIKIKFLKILFSVIVLQSLFGCGTFDLGLVYSTSGQSIEQRDGDMAICKVKAHEAANSAGRQAGNFIAGMTIIGAPIAIEDEKRMQREIFAKCMTEKGYRVEPPKDQNNKNKAISTTEINSTTTNTSAITGKPRYSIKLDDGWKDQVITDQLKSVSVVLYSANFSIDAGLIITKAKTKYVNDPDKFVETSMRNLESILKNTQRGEVLIKDINGIQSAQYEMSGTQNVNGTNVEMKYLSILVVDKEDIYLIRFNTLTHNYEFHKSHFIEKLNTLTIAEPLNVFKIGNRNSQSAGKIKEKCKSLGFVEGSEEFSNCILEIFKREK